MYCYGANNPVKYTDPDGEVAFCVVTAIAGAVIGGSIAAYNSYKQIGHVNGWKVVEGIAIGGVVGLGFGLLSAESLTATALQGGNCLASFGVVTRFGTATTTIAGVTTSTSAVPSLATESMDKFFSIVGEGISLEAQNFTFSAVDMLIKDPRKIKNLCIGLIEMSKTQKGRELLKDVHTYSSRLISSVNNQDLFNALKYLQDYSGTLSGGGN